MDGFPDAKEFDGVPVAQPVGDEKVAVLGLEHVGQRNEVLVFGSQDGYDRALDFDGGFLGFAHRVWSAEISLKTEILPGEVAR